MRKNIQHSRELEVPYFSIKRIKIKKKYFLADVHTLTTIFGLQMKETKKREKIESEPFKGEVSENSFYAINSVQQENKLF